VAPGSDPSTAITSESVASIIRELPRLAVLAFDRELRFTFAGGAALADHGWDAESLVGRVMPEAFPEDTVRQLLPLYAAALAGEASSFELRSHDHLSVYAVTITPSREDGKVIGGFALAQDITATVNMRDQAAVAAEQSRRVFADAAVGMLIASLTGVILDVNTSLCEMLGYERDELVGRTWAEITHPDERERDVRAVMDIAAQRSPPVDSELDSHRIEKRYLHRDGRVVWANLSARLLRDANGRPLRFIAQVVDITTRKLAQEALHASETRFRTLASFAPVGITITDASGRLTYANARFCEFAGMTPAQALGDGWQAAIHPDDRALVAAGLERARAGQAELSLECRFRTPDGHVRHLHTLSTSLRDEQGTVSGRIGVLVDVTDRVAATRQFEQLLEFAPDAIIGIDVDGRIVTSNRRTEDLFGYTRAELSGRLVDTLLPEPLRGAHEKHRAGFFADPHTRPMAPELQLRALRKDGSEFPSEISLTAIDTPQGALAVAAIRDVTDRLRAEQDAARLAAVVESSHDAIISHDLDGSVTSWNTGAERLYGYTSDEMLGRSMSVLVPPGHDDELPGILRRMRAGERIDDYESVGSCKDGTLVDVSLTVSPIRDHRGTVVGASTIARDISVRLRHQQQLVFLAEHDALTGAHNRGRFERDISEQVARARRYNEKAALLMIDVNDFKQINDSHGHKAGDEALRAIAAVLRQRVRDTDVVARLGGDEFAVLVPHADLAHASALANDLRRLISECRIQTAAHTDVQLSASIGIAQIDEHTPTDEAALIQADDAMYAEKRQRRQTPPTARAPGDGADG
jgi:diguanylate cyclase (GGDEF)-like protein/PAS domain S-box-containing protein